MALQFTPIRNDPASDISDSVARDSFGAVVSGIDIASATDKDIACIETAMDRYAVLVFRDQKLTDQQQYEFSSRFGEMEKATGDINQSKDRRLAMDINDISNLDKSGKVRARYDRARLFGLGNMLWHSDSSFKTVPAKYSLLSARVIPDAGGNTEFADMRAAWAALDTATQNECLDLVCEHSQIYSRGMLGFEDFTDEERTKWAPVHQPLVRSHPVTDEKSLFLSSHIGTVVGWPVPEARLFIRDLTEHATGSDFIFSHQWKQWDLVMWDNRVTMHRARRYDHTQPRDLHRTTVAGDSKLV
jgi:alpha-ketoglutarate-dependent 2,4-dichlorophenoxyacetate dioxygenase